MSFKPGFLTALCILLFLSACSSTINEDQIQRLDDLSVIPIPQSVTPKGKDYFTVSKTTVVRAEGKIADIIKTELKQHTENMLGVSESQGNNPNTIVFKIAPQEDKNPEAYSLDISSKTFTATANTEEGLYRALQTIKQMINTDQLLKHQSIGIQTGKIVDAPKYPFRSIMIDVARHFFTPEDIKKQIDQLAFYKINHLHLHLTDDQGWRIEIKSWPNLTKKGGISSVDGNKPGFYTQEEYKDIVAYAAARHITIIPEIDMPSHINAALASYASLNPEGEVKELYTGISVGFSTLTNTLDSTFIFVNDVIKEVCDMTPGPYFHIGGDEAEATTMEDYKVFIDKAQTIIHNNDKIMIGWDEIAHAQLKPNQIVQFWKKENNTIMGLEKGSKVIMSPAPKSYLDMKYSDTTKLGLKWAGYIPIDSAYLWNPETYSKNIKQNDIIGVEAPLWAETIVEVEDLEYLLYPRALGYAEIGWSGSKEWSDYAKRLKQHQSILAKNKINYFESPIVNEE